MKISIFVAIIAIIGVNSHLTAEDEGYFLSMKQKGELITEGKITDKHGNIYDVWICPGYKAPTDIAIGEGWGEGSRAFGEYFDSNLYEKMANTSGDCLEWAWDDCIKQGLIEGIPNAWSDHFSTASSRVNQRVFGWFLAYPTAFCTALFDNALRIPITIMGCTLGNVVALGVVPGYYTFKPGLEGTGRYLFPGTLVPVAGYTINTIIAPPLSLIGERPTPSQVDGFWVTMESYESVQNIKLTKKNKDFFAQWGNLLYDNLHPFDESIEKENKEHRRKLQELSKEEDRISNESDKTVKQFKLEKENKYKSLMDNEKNQELLNKLNQSGLNQYHINANRSALREHLESEGASTEKIDEIMELIQQFNKLPFPINSQRKKIEPVSDSFKKAEKIIKEID